MMPIEIHFEHLKIQLEAIKSATNSFSDDNCIGEGGFGKMYKGELVHRKGQSVVAIKRLDRAFGQGNTEFWREITMLSLYEHENIVSLLGYCDESDEKVLVYEYASRGSLDLYLKSSDLTWIQRLNICIGAARGLAYLHDPGITQQRVLHRDIKSSNILLDENWNARISDLGLSKFGPANQKYTFQVSSTVGTIGYCDPLYAATGLLTKESDVYSFGVVLFEILCGRLSIDNNNDNGRSLTILVRHCYEQNKMEEIIYGNIKDEIRLPSLETFIKIAYQCLKNDFRERPFMSKVVKLGDEYMAGPSTQDIMILKKCVLKVDMSNDRDKIKALKIVSSISGADSVSVDMKEKKLTIIGDDAVPVMIVIKLSKLFYIEIISVGPTKIKRRVTGINNYHYQQQIDNIEHK